MAHKHAPGPQIARHKLEGDFVLLAFIVPGEVGAQFRIINLTDDEVSTEITAADALALTSMIR
ncbi:MAG: hypothetical protein ABI467_25055 [Kofleriaceae bacterium]